MLKEFSGWTEIDLVCLSYKRHFFESFTGDPLCSPAVVVHELERQKTDNCSSHEAGCFSEIPVCVKSARFLLNKILPVFRHLLSLFMEDFLCVRHHARF